MIDLSFLQGGAYGVLGLGMTGRTSVRALCAARSDVYCWDDAPAQRQMPSSARLLAPSQWPWPRLRAVIVSPGVPLEGARAHPVCALATKYHTPLLSDIALYAAARQARPPEERPFLLALTGTNGKTTVLRMFAHILRIAGRHVEEAGNIGRAVLSLPDFAGLHRDHVHALEMSSFQLALMPPLRPDVAMCLNIDEDHADMHESKHSYAETKMRLFAGLDARTHAVVQHGDLAQQLLEKRTTKARLWCLSRGDLLAGRFFSVQDKILAGILQRSRKTTTLAEHDECNLIFAAAAALLAGVDAAQIDAAMVSFTKPAHRQEVLCGRDGVYFVNDSKATNLHAVQAAIRRFSPVHLLLGGVAKGADFSQINSFVRAGGHASSAIELKHVYCFGRDAAQIKAQLPKSLSSSLHKDLGEAFAAALANATRDTAMSQARQGGCVLLSPGCASFDAYDGYAQRGEAFKKLVQDWVRDGSVTA